MSTQFTSQQYAPTPISKIIDTLVLLQNCESSKNCSAFSIYTYTRIQLFTICSLLELYLHNLLNGGDEVKGSNMWQCHLSIFIFTQNQMIDFAKTKCAESTVQQNGVVAFKVETLTDRFCTIIGWAQILKVCILQHILSIAIHIIRQ